MSHSLKHMAGKRESLALQSIFWLLGLLLLVGFASLHVGAAETDVLNVVRDLIGKGGVNEHTIARDEVILLDIRLPRFFMGALVGSALAVGGAVLQSLFRNPLADPGIIGISAGATFGAVSVIVLGGSITAILGSFALPLAAFFGALIATYTIYFISTSKGQTSVITMLLAGIAMQAFAFALTGLLIYCADDLQLRELTFWNLGSLAGANWPKIIIATPIILIGFCLLQTLVRGLNAFALGEAAAFHMGIATQHIKFLAICLVSAITGAAVAFTGGIGFIGIVVPHILRIMIGPDNRFLLPASALFGASLLICADMIARIVVSPAELPIGVVTALIGAPFFVWLLVRRKGMLLQ